LRRHPLDGGVILSPAILPEPHSRPGAPFQDRRLSAHGVAISGDAIATGPVTTFELVINRKTARTPGLDIAPAMLAHADGVIE
jgi:hypothetical protein